MTLEDFAEAFADGVRKAFGKAYGPPRNKEVSESIYPSWSDRGISTGWQDPDPRIVVVGTEHGWVQDPFTSQEDYQLWGKTADELTKEGWGKVWWDSINPAVHVVYIDLPDAWHKTLSERAKRRAEER